jgi:branched-chain amino acid transport system ATP-binding protein
MSTAVSTSARHASDSDDAPRLEARGVTVRFGGLVANKDVDLAVGSQQIVGLVGPNGAGKSTLFAVLSGLLRPTAGRVFMDGQDVTGTTPQKRAIRGLARTFQHPELFSSLTVREHLVLAYRMKNAKGRIWTDLVTGRGFGRPPKAEDTRVDDLVDSLQLGAIQHRPAAGLPLGSARLLEIARALAVEPRVLLLDEPSSGLDVRETEEVATVLKSVVRDHGVSLLMVEHDVELVLGMSDAVHVLDFGVKIAGGTPAEVRKDPAVRAAYLGEEVEKPAVQQAEAEIEKGDVA